MWGNGVHGEGFHVDRLFCFVCLKGLNANFLVSIPKMRGAEDIKDFRLIWWENSIRSCQFFLGNKLKKGGGDIKISQSMNGRMIVDAFLIANGPIPIRSSLVGLRCESGHWESLWPCKLKVSCFNNGESRSHAKWVRWIKLLSFCEIYNVGEWKIRKSLLKFQGLC